MSRYECAVRSYYQIRLVLNLFPDEWFCEGRPVREVVIAGEVRPERTCPGMFRVVFDDLERPSTRLVGRQTFPPNLQQEASVAWQSALDVIPTAMFKPAREERIPVRPSNSGPSIPYGYGRRLPGPG